MADSLIQSRAKLIECKSNYPHRKEDINYQDAAISTDLLPQMIDINVGTVCNATKDTQTEITRQFAKDYDEQSLVKCLRKLEKIMQEELDKDSVPTIQSCYWKFYSIAQDCETRLGGDSFHSVDGDDDGYFDEVAGDDDSEQDQAPDGMEWWRNNRKRMPNIKIYQELQLPKNNDQTINTNAEQGNEEYRGLATWLAVHCNNAPALVVASVIGHHDNWCEHVDLSKLHIYVPKRLAKDHTIILYEEITTISLKACLCSINTNSYNRTIFAGATFDGSVYVWQLQSNLGRDNSSIQILELYHLNPTQGLTVALDWNDESMLMTAHCNGYVVLWNIQGELAMEETK